jgi:hypothetical protein
MVGQPQCSILVALARVLERVLPLVRLIWGLV